MESHRYAQNELKNVFSFYIHHFNNKIRENNYTESAKGQIF